MKRLEKALIVICVLFLLIVLFIYSQWDCVDCPIYKIRCPNGTINSYEEKYHWYCLSSCIIPYCEDGDIS